MNWTSALAAHDRENRERKEKTNLESEATSSYNAGSADQTESNTSTTESQLEKRAMNEVWFVNDLSTSSYVNLVTFVVCEEINNGDCSSP